MSVLTVDEVAAAQPPAFATEEPSGYWPEDAYGVMHAPIKDGLNAGMYLIEQADGWRAGISARLSGQLEYEATPQSSHPPFGLRIEAVLQACEAAIEWCSHRKQEKLTKRQVKDVEVLQEWALYLEKEEGNWAAAAQAQPLSRSSETSVEQANGAQGNVGEVADDDQIPAAQVDAMRELLDQAPELRARTNGALVVQMIAIELLYESPWNPRQQYPETAMRELVESMKASGFRQWLPMMVRPIVGASEVWQRIDQAPGFEIGAGHRRSRAAREAGITHVPCVVREMTDEEFLDVLNFDNSGREDVHPLDESAGWRQWMDKTGKGVLDIAAKIGQSKEYVYERLKYASLTDAARQAFLDDKIGKKIAVSLARLPEKEQAKQLKWLAGQGRTVTTREFEQHLRWDAYVQLDESTPFNRADASLLAGAGTCETCPKRAANIPGFDYGERQDPQEPLSDYCTDRTCHQQKVTNHLFRIEEDFRANLPAPAGLAAAIVLRVVDGWSQKTPKGAYKSEEWEKAKKGDKDAKPAIVVQGGAIGETLYVKLRKNTNESSQDIRRRQEEQRAKEQGKAERELTIRRAILDGIRAKTGGGLTRADVEALVFEVARSNGPLLCELYAIDGKSDDAFFRALPKLSEAQLFQIAVIAPCLDEFDEWRTRDEAKQLVALAKRYKVDAVKIRLETEKKLKEAEGGTVEEVIQRRPTLDEARTPKPKGDAKKSAAAKKAPAKRAAKKKKGGKK